MYEKFIEVMREAEGAYAGACSGMKCSGLDCTECPFLDEESFEKFLNYLETGEEK